MLRRIMYECFFFLYDRAVLLLFKKKRFVLTHWIFIYHPLNPLLSPSSRALPPPFLVRHAASFLLVCRCGQPSPHAASHLRWPALSRATAPTTTRAAPRRSGPPPAAPPPIALPAGAGMPQSAGPPHLASLPPYDALPVRPSELLPLPPPLEKKLPPFF